MPVLVHHIVGLIEHGHPDRPRVDRPALQKIADLPGHPDHHVRVDALPPVHPLPRQRQPHAEAGHVPRHGRDAVLDDLDGELPDGGA